MCKTASATMDTSIIGSAGASPWLTSANNSVPALPTSIWPQAMSKSRPSSDRLRVRPVTACFEAV